MMKKLLNEIADNITGIWANEKYELILGLNETFIFTERKSEEIIDGTFSIIQQAETHYPTLRLTEQNGTNHDYIIFELSVFKSLTISIDGERIQFKNISPDEYEGDVFNPSNN